MVSKAELAVQAVQRFQQWVAERERAGDWNDYVRGGKLNRSELAKECEFGRAAIQQNPGLTQALATLETSLAERGVLSAAPLAAQDLSPELKAQIGAADDRVRRALISHSALERRIKTLEEQNASLKAENNELRERLRRSTLADQHLAQTGRMLPP